MKLNSLRCINKSITLLQEVMKDTTITDLDRDVVNNLLMNLTLIRGRNIRTMAIKTAEENNYLVTIK